MADQTACPICNQPAAQPYRQYNAAGELTQKCVAAFHDSPTDAWHRRPLGRWPSAMRRVV